MEKLRPTEKPWIGKPLVEVRVIRNRHARKLMDGNPNVVAVSIGREENQDSRYFVIKGFLVEEPTVLEQDRLPSILEEVPVRYCLFGQAVPIKAHFSSST